MKKVINKIALFSVSLFIACGGSTSKEPEVVNEAPSTVNLVYPTENLLCIDNTIVFDWTDATDANNDNIRYKVEFSNSRDMAVIVKTETVSSSTKSITVDKGVPISTSYTPGLLKKLSKQTSFVPLDFGVPKLL